MSWNWLFEQVIWAWASIHFMWRIAAWTRHFPTARVHHACTTVGMLKTLATYRRYLHGELTPQRFAVAEGGYKKVERR